MRNALHLLNINPVSEDADKDTDKALGFFYSRFSFFPQIYFRNFIKSCSYILLIV